MRAMLLLACAATLCAQQATLFRASVSLVHVDVQVTRDGRIVSGLGKADFRVLDEKVERPILRFSAEEQPLDVMLLPLTADFAAVERTIREDVVGMKFSGFTFLQNALDAAAKNFMAEKRTERRRAVLIVTDNMGQRTRRTSSVVRDFWEADALLSELLVGRTLPKWAQGAGYVFAPHIMLARVGIAGVVDKTGGDAFHSDDPGTGFTGMCSPGCVVNKSSCPLL